MSDTLHQLAILWDMDGTLVDTEEAGLAALREAFREVAGVELRDDERWHGRSENDFFRETLEARGLKHLANEVHSAFHRLYLPHLDEVEPLPGVCATIDAVMSVGIQAIVSGSARHQIERVMRTLDIADAMSLIVGAEDYERGKPSPAPYLLAAERLDIPASKCVVVEDSEVGVASACAAGMRVVGVLAGNVPGRYDLSDADVVLQSLDELSVDLVLGLLDRD